MSGRRVLIALDGSAIAAHALEAALAQALGAEVALVHVVDPKLAFAPEASVPAATLMAQANRDGQDLLTTAAARVAGPAAPEAVPARGQTRQHESERFSCWSHAWFARVEPCATL
jgi:nucleotide-binding universal stress UspA family protein